MLFAVTSLVIEHARAGPEASEQNDSLRLRDLGTQRLTVGQISPVAPPEQTATPTPTATPALTPEPTLPSSQFNPDPGSGKEEIPVEPPILFPPVVPEPPEYGEEPLPRSLELPRKGVRESVPQRHKLDYETYPESEEGEGVLPKSERCRIAGSLGSVAGNGTPIPQRKRRINRARSNSGIPTCRAS